MSRLGGKEALAQIDTMLSRARGALGDVEHRYGEARTRLARCRRQALGAYAQLARLRMMAIESGSLLDSLDSADRSVKQVLEDRGRAAATLDERIEAANARLGEHEAQRADQAGAVAEAGETLDAAEAQAQERLRADSAWQAQLQSTEQAEFVAEQAAQKSEAAQRDRIDKGKPYEDDPLFSYLWQRGFGTSRYAAWPLARWLDTRVARLCGYEAARRDYRLLTEIPERLREHAAAMRTEFERELESLRDIETKAAAAANVPELGEALQAQEQELARIDAQTAPLEQALRELVREKVQFANGNDPYYARCIEILHRAMSRKGLVVLRERAARTPAPDDDEIVARLVELESDAQRLEDDLADYGRVYERESARLREFEDVRRQFRSERFDDSRSEFLDAALFTLVLERLLNGTVSGRDAWKAIRRQQRTRRHRADPRFGTRRFPGSRRAGPWRWPPGGGGGGFGGGGFGSGGGFGGGGFRSGGGF